LHDLRHSFASFLVNGGVSLYVVQQLLGHINHRTTQRYAHLMPEALTQAVASLDEHLMGKPGGLAEASAPQPQIECLFAAPWADFPST
jgi:hypothetical protein